MTDDERQATLRWKIDKDIELYRFYLDVSVKASVFLMAVTGAIASYVLSKPGGSAISIALAFPATVNIGFAIFYFYSIIEAKRIVRVHVETAKALGVPEVNMKPLRSVCQIFCAMCALAAIGLLVVMVFHLRGAWPDVDRNSKKALDCVMSPRFAIAGGLPSAVLRQTPNPRSDTDPSHQRFALLLRTGQAYR